KIRHQSSRVAESFMYELLSSTGDGAFWPSWSSQAVSNILPPACKAGALPAELWPRSVLTSRQLVDLGTFELPNSALSGVRYKQLSYRPNYLGLLLCCPVASTSPCPL